jgi:hypothetical protein
MSQDEEVVEEDSFLAVSQPELEGLDAVEGPVYEDLMLGHIIIIE